MVDGSTSKPMLRQDTGYMVEKTYLDIDIDTRKIAALRAAFF